MKELVDYWQHGFDWRRHERALNEFALFPKDISQPPREWAQRFFNVQRWTQVTPDDALETGRLALDLSGNA